MEGYFPIKLPCYDSPVVAAACVCTQRDEMIQTSTPALMRETETDGRQGAERAELPEETPTGRQSERARERALGPKGPGGESGDIF